MTFFFIFVANFKSARTEDEGFFIRFNNNFWPNSRRV